MSKASIGSKGASNMSKTLLTCYFPLDCPTEISLRHSRFRVVWVVCVEYTALPSHVSRLLLVSCASRKPNFETKFEKHALARQLVVALKVAPIKINPCPLPVFASFISFAQLLDARTIAVSE